MYLFNSLDQRILWNLQARIDIIIHLADKAGRIVVLDVTVYLTEADRQPRDSNLCRLLDHDTAPDFSKHVNTTLLQLLNDKKVSPECQNVWNVKISQTVWFWHLWPKHYFEMLLEHFACRPKI